MFPPWGPRREIEMSTSVFSSLCALCVASEAFCGLGFSFNYTQEELNPGEITYRFFLTPDSPEMQLIGVGGYSAELFEFFSETPLIQRDDLSTDSYLGWGDDETDFSDDFPEFEGSSIETFDGFYFDANLATPLLGSVQIAQATLDAGSGFSFSGIGRYLVNGDKIDLSFEFNTIPAAGAVGPLLLLFGRTRKRS